MPLLPWILLGAVLAVAGLAVLAALAIRVFAAVRELGNEVERSQQQLESKLAEVEAAGERDGGTDDWTRRGGRGVGRS